MTTSSARHASISCRDFVDVVTAYLDDTLPDHTRSAIETHLETCEGCRNVLAQWRTVVALAGRLTEDDVNVTDPRTRDRLISTFRDIRRR